MVGSRCLTLLEAPAHHSSELRTTASLSGPVGALGGIVGPPGASVHARAAAIVPATPLTSVSNLPPAPMELGACSLPLLPVLPPGPVPLGRGETGDGAAPSVAPSCARPATALHVARMAPDTLLRGVYFLSGPLPRSPLGGGGTASSPRHLPSPPPATPRSLWGGSMGARTDDGTPMHA